MITSDRFCSMGWVLKGYPSHPRKEFKAVIANNEGREVKVESITACWENRLKVPGAKGTMSWRSSRSRLKEVLWRHPRQRDTRKIGGRP